MAFQQSRSSNYGLNDGMSLENWYAIQEEAEKNCNHWGNEDIPFSSDKYYDITNEMMQLKAVDNFELPFGNELTEYEKNILKDLANTMRRHYKYNKNDAKHATVITRYNIDSLKFRRLVVQKFLFRNNAYACIDIYQEGNKVQFEVSFLSDLQSVNVHKVLFFKDWGEQEYSWFEGRYKTSQWLNI